jgi:hypothetical protein
MITKENINHIVNEYLKFDSKMIGTGPHPDEEYDEQYRFWLEQMERNFKFKKVEEGV